MQHAPAGSDTSVQGTNDDAQISKLSCVNMGYFQDEYVRHFVRRGSTRRSPLINRGYYARTAALRQFLDMFLEATSGHSGQVLNLGAGFDTTWFQLKAQGRAPAQYFEVDFPPVAANKAAVIAHTPHLHTLLGPEAAQCVDAEAGRIATQQYQLVPADLRDLAGLDAALAAAGFDPSRPTYVLAECVFVYMPPADSAAVVGWLGARLPTAALVIYEQIRPEDAFGRQMLLNLESRGCPLLGIYGTPSLEAHRRRLTDGGWHRAEAADMEAIYKRHLDATDKRRIERLEIFDEFEEWHMFQEHYCITVGINDSMGTLKNFGLQTQTPSNPPPPRFPVAD